MYEPQYSTNIKKILRLNLQKNVNNVNPQEDYDEISGVLIRMMFDGLMRRNLNNEIVPSVAKSVEVSKDYTSFKFHLRKTYWSNGEALTSFDFERSWKAMLKSNRDSPLIHLFFFIKNAELYYKGLSEEVGINAVDDDLFIVTLEKPTPFFLELTTLFCFYPIHSSGNKELNGNYISNGPFSHLKHNKTNKLTLNKNKYYWDYKNVNIEEVSIGFEKDKNKDLKMFLGNETDWCGKPTGKIPLNSFQSLEKSHSLNISPIASTFWYSFNTEFKPLSNKNIRKAFSLAIDRFYIVNKVTLAGEIPAESVLPPTMRNIKMNSPLRKEYDDAKKLLEQGLNELNLKVLPKIEIKFERNYISRIVTEAIKEQLERNLGISVEIIELEKQKLNADLKTKNFHVVRTVWVAEYNDPTSFLNIFITKNSSYNYSRWENEKFINCLKKSYTAKNFELRQKILNEAEDILIKEYPILPVYFRTQVWVKNPKLHQEIIDPLGFIDFKWADFY